MQPIDHEDIAQRLRKGSYFDEARQWYSLVYHTPMAERSYFIIVTILSLFATLFSVMGLMGLFPLQPKKPFYIPTQDAAMVPAISPLAAETEDPNVALSHFLVERYVTAREEYDSETKVKYARFVRRQGTPEVTAIYDRDTAQSNPYSPSARYEDKLERHITITSIEMSPAGTDPRTAKVHFDASVGNFAQNETSQWVADVQFRFTGISIHQETEEITPMTFIVTGYNVHEEQVGTQ